MGSLSELAVVYMREGKDLTSEWTDEAIKMVKADTEGFLEDRGATIGGVLYMGDNDVSRVFRRR